MSINPSHTPGYAPSQGFPPPPPPPVAAPANVGGKIALLFGIMIALLVGTGYTFYQVSQLREQMGKYQASVQAQLDKIQEASTLTSQSHRKSVEALRDQLEVARRQASMAAGAARTEALRNVQEARQALETEQKQAREQVNTELAAVKQAADTTNTKIDSVGTEVVAVKTDVASTKTQLEKTISDLKETRGDLTGQGVLIATNGKELAALRTLGERNYVEFTVHKQKQPQKVGDVQLALKKTDPKHNRYSIELTADDKTVEKKDRSINEPLQFMTSKAAQPYELVVNDVKKDTIVGYLSIPKVLKPRNQ